MPPIITSAEIGRPAAEVFAYATDPARALLDRGFSDLTVLDSSAAGIRHARDRLGPRADQVHPSRSRPFAAPHPRPVSGRVRTCPTRVTNGWTVLRDANGNEFCIARAFRKPILL